MGIETVVMGADGQKVASVEDPTNILHRVLPSHDDKRFECINRIDWYGDTTFNRHQLPVLRDEIHRLADSVLISEHKELLGRIDVLAVRCQSVPHLYLKFIGD